MPKLNLKNAIIGLGVVVALLLGVRAVVRGMEADATRFR